MNTRKQAGFGHLGPIIAILLVLAIVGVVGYTVMNRQPADKTNDTKNQSTSRRAAKELTASDAPTIEQASDLDKASAALDKVGSSGDTSDTNQLNRQLSGL